MQVADHSIGFPATLKLDEIAVHFVAQWGSGTAQTQGQAVNFTWLNVQGHIVLQLDHDNASTQCKRNFLDADKFCLVIATVAAQGRVGLTVVLFVVLWALNHHSCGTSAQVPSYANADDFSFHTVLLCGESEGN